MGCRHGRLGVFQVGSVTGVRCTPHTVVHSAQDSRRPSQAGVPVPSASLGLPGWHHSLA